MTMKNQYFIVHEAGMIYSYSLEWDNLEDNTLYTLKEISKLILPAEVRESLEEGSLLPVIPGFQIHPTTLTRLSENIPYDFREVVYPKSGVAGIRKIRVYLGKDVKEAVVAKDRRFELSRKPK
jgi:hypothetical protein